MTKNVSSAIYSLIVLAACSCASEAGTAGDAENAMAGIRSIDTLANAAVHVVSTSEGVWAHSSVDPWRLVEDLRIGVADGDERYMFGGIGGVIPTPDGRIWVLDGMAYQLRLYDREGTFVRAVGRDGEGPGEFGFNPCAFHGPEGEVWVEAGGRWQWFDSEGGLLGQQRVTRNLGCGIQRWVSHDRFVAVHVEGTPRSRERESYFLIHSREPSGEVAVTDTAHRPVIPENQRVEWFDADRRSRISVLMPLIHRATYVLGPNGDFWISDGSGEYCIRRQTLFGDTLVIMERPYEPISVPDSIRDDAMPERRRRDLTLDRSFDPDDIPRVFPPFDRLLIGTDGTLWVRRQLEDGLYGLDVFASDGRFLGPVEAPPEFDRMGIHRITPDYMYGTVRDEMDVQYVVRLAIRKPEG